MANLNLGAVGSPGPTSSLGEYYGTAGIAAIKEITGQRIFLVTSPQFIWNKKDKCVVNTAYDSNSPYFEDVFTVIHLLKDEELPKFLKDNKDNYLVFYVNKDTGSIFHSSDTYLCPHCGTIQPSKITRHVRVYIDINERKTKLNKLNKIK